MKPISNNADIQRAASASQASSSKAKTTDQDIVSESSTKTGPVENHGVITASSLITDQSLATTTVREEVQREKLFPLLNQNPFGNIFDLKEPIDVNELKEKAKPTAEEHGKFFKRLYNILRQSNKDQVLDKLRLLENETLDPNNSSKLTLQKINSLISVYRQLSMPDVIRFYKRLEYNSLPTSDFMKANYALALNRIGSPQEAIEVALPYVSKDLSGKKISSQDVQLQAEFLTVIGTARKETFLNTGNTEALEEANKAYLTAFERSLSYYPGVNVVRTFIYKSDIKKAKQYAKVVQQATMHADTQKSFWPIATQLEMAIVLGKQKQANKLLSSLGSLIAGQEKSDVDSLIKHLKFVRDKNLLTGVDLNDIIQKLENPSLIQQAPDEVRKEGWKYKSVTDAIEQNTYVIGRTRTGNTTPFNAKHGGLVVDFNVKPIDHEIRKDVLDKLTEGKLTETPLPDFIKTTHRYVEDLFSLRKDGIRDIENMTEPRHIELEAFWIAMKDLVSYDLSQMGATSMMITPNLPGDCRHTNATFQYLGNGKIRADREEVILQLLDDIRNNRESDFEANIQKLDKNRKKFVLMDTKIFSKIKNNGPYQVVRESEDGTKGRALLSEKDSEEHIDSHTLTFLIDYDKDGNVISLVECEENGNPSAMAVDTWYSSEDIFQSSNAVIKGEALKEFARTGKLVIEKGARVLNQNTGQEEFIPITLEPEVFSGPRQRVAKRQDAQSLVLGSFVIDRPDLDLYFDPSKREAFYKNFVKPVIIHGLNLMVVNDKKPFDQLRAAKYLAELIQESPN
ncbi:MAG: DUF4071 domain-containing protein [Candidatus Melainabacteria bacterium]|nr:DUF4071 domain-containing protein [Candidatus Melainabacteria bacterium]